MTAGDAVVVIGAGPAGAGTALRLAQLGCRVFLFEKRATPRGKVCGGCLHRRGLTLLEAWGVAGVCRRAGAVVLNGAELATPWGAVAWPRAHGVAVDRVRFDAALIDEAKRHGVLFRDRASVRVRAFDPGEQSWAYTVDGSETQTARVIVVADGVAGSSLAEVQGFTMRRRPRSRVGAAARLPGNAMDVPHGVVRMHYAAVDYVGVVRRADGDLDVAAAISPERLRSERRVARLVADVLAESGAGGRVQAAALEADWSLTPPFTVSRERVAAPGLFVVGDGAGYIEPFTGEGMTWALHAAGRAARIAAGSIKGELSAGAAALRWSRAVRSQRWKAQTRCRAMQAMLQRPTVMLAAVRAARCWPWLRLPAWSKSPDTAGAWA